MMPNDAKFWDKIANKYAASPIKNMEAYNQTMDRTKSHLSKGDSVLEVGCGTGSTALLLADSVDHITASDISANMIGIAKGKARDQEVENVDFLQWTLPDQAPMEGPFDAVMAFNFLHLVEDTPEAVRRIKSLLKPDGLFISKTVCLGEKSWLWSPIIAVMRLVGFAPYVRSLKIRELEELITEAGFRIIETGVYPAPSSRFIVARKT